jgi:glycerophosphoryl diester phosphodiesterase
LNQLFFICILLNFFIGKSQNDKLEIYGHRGFRGSYPENSLIGFQKAIELGITGIELDVVVNKDKQLVISHEPFFQSSFCLDSSGNEIKNERIFNIYNLTQKEIASFDCGSKYYDKFPEQKKLKTTKPLFQELVSLNEINSTIILLEIKSTPSEYNYSQPEPSMYSDLILGELKKFTNKSNIRIMSFDKAILEQIHKKDSEYPLIYLTYMPKSVKSLLKELSFKPFALGMFYPTIRKKSAHYLHHRSIKLFAWTVNDLKWKNKLMKLNIDGIITDYPDLFR